MKKQLIVVGIIVVLLTVGLSGCNEETSDNSNNDLESEKVDTSLLKEKFETAMKSIAFDFVDELPSTSSANAYNHDTSQTEIDYILNYSQPQFEAHRDLIYRNDDICNNSYYYDYIRCRDHVIEGLQYLVDKEYYEAWSSLLAADCDIFDVNMYGDMWCIQFGFENGVVDILFDMGYWGDYFEWGG